MDESDASRILELVLMLYVTKKVLERIDIKTWNNILEGLKKKEVKVIKPLSKTIRIKRKVVLVRGNDAKKVKKRGKK